MGRNPSSSTPLPALFYFSVQKSCNGLEANGLETEKSVVFGRVKVHKVEAGVEDVVTLHCHSALDEEPHRKGAQHSSSGR